MGIRILIADDHAIVRAGIRALLQLHPDFEVVGEAGDGHEAILQVRRLQPDVVLMDLAMPGMDGLAATHEICRISPQTRVLVLSQHENREYVLPALRAGAAGYVLKRAPDDTLIRAIRAVYAGETYVDPRLAELLVEEVRRSTEGSGGPTGYSDGTGTGNPDPAGSGEELSGDRPDAVY